MLRDVYFGRLKLYSEEDRPTLLAASNYAASLMNLKRFGQAKVVLRKAMPVARRVLGESHDIALKMRLFYAAALYQDDDASPDDLPEAVKTLEEVERTARRVLGGANPTTADIECELKKSRAKLRARETPDA